jgi:hypothetical protein
LRPLVEAPPATGRARRLGHQFIELAGRIFITSRAELFEVWHQADKRAATGATVQNFFLDFFRELGKRLVDVDAALVSQFEQQTLERPLEFRTVYR